MTFFQNPQVIFVLFVFVYYNYTHTFDQTFPHQEPLPWQFSSALCAGMWKDVGVNSSDGLDFRIPKV